jgi:hypothetical protein
MKKRYKYSLLFGVPGFFVSLIMSFFVFGGAAGFLWIFVFGDKPWPTSTEKTLPIFFILIFLALWTASITVGFKTGKNLKDNSKLAKKHIMVSAGVTIVSIILIILHQLSVGNIGPKSDSILCSEFCSEKGYSGSGMPPVDSGELTCSCFDDYGKEVIKVSMDSFVSDNQK